MTKVEIYTIFMCPYCERAKALFTKKSIKATEYQATGKAEIKAEMIARSGGKTSFPQIFINDKHIGGCDDLYRLEDEGRLDGLLAR